MDEEMDYKIMSYLKGRLSAEEAALFEKEIADDAVLRKEVELQRFEMEGMESLVREDLLKKVAQWEVEEAAQIKSELVNKPWWKNWVNWLDIVLILGIIIMASIIIFDLRLPLKGPLSPSISKERTDKSPSSKPQVQLLEKTYYNKSATIESTINQKNGTQVNPSLTTKNLSMAFFGFILLTLIHLLTIRLRARKVKKILTKIWRIIFWSSSLLVFSGLLYLIWQKPISVSVPHKRVLEPKFLIPNQSLKKDSIKKTINKNPQANKNQPDFTPIIPLEINDEYLVTVALSMHEEEIKKIGKDVRGIAVTSIVDQGDDLFKEKKYLEVIQLLEQAKYDPQDTVNFQGNKELLGHSYFARGRYEEAAQAFRDIVAQNYGAEFTHPAEWNLLLSLLPNLSKNRAEVDRLLRKMLTTEHIFTQQAKNLQAEMNGR